MNPEKLNRLARLTADSGLEEKASQLSRTFAENVRRFPAAFTQLMLSIDFALGPSYEIVIAGDLESKSTVEMLQALHREFIPNAVVMQIPPEPHTSGIRELIPFLKEMPGMPGQTVVYVCRNHQCKLPTNDIHHMLKLLHSSQS